MRDRIERFRIAAFVVGCGLLFWQYDAAALDWAFLLGIVASAALWERGLPAFDLRWPQPLLLLFLTVTALATVLAGGSPRFFVITLYLAVLALALASALRRAPSQVRSLEAAIVVAGSITAGTVAAGAAATQLGMPFLEVFAYDSLRGQGLFKDPNVAGAFLACSYPLAAARCVRLRQGRLIFLLIATAVFGSGVVFSYSRLALLLFLLGIGAVAMALALSRERRLALGLAGVAVAAVAAGLTALPAYRYQPVHAYDELGRLAAWRLGAETVLENPLGTGAGSFERLAIERFGTPLPELERDALLGLSVDELQVRLRAAAVEARRRYASGAAPPTETGNLATNGGFDGSAGWPLADYAAIVSDPTSVTGHALRKETTAIFQDPGQRIAVAPGHMYSFGAQIRTDGTPASLVIHWRDEHDATIAQAAARVVASDSWTEAQLPAQVAPPGATHVAVLLSNREPGTQHFTALRVVEGPTVPPWSPEMQRLPPAADEDKVVVVEDRRPRPASAHNTYIRVSVESGVPGLVVLGGYLLLLAWSAWRWGGSSWQWPIAFCLVVLAGLAIDTLHWRQLWIYGAVVAASFARPPLGEAARQGGTEAVPRPAHASGSEPSSSLEPRRAAAARRAGARPS